MAAPAGRLGYRKAAARLTHNRSGSKLANKAGRSEPSEVQTGKNLGQALGWFSIGLGLAEVIAPNALARLIGMPPSPTLMRLYGLREIATGLGIFGQKRPTESVAARVAGDGLDMVTLLGSMASRRARPGRLALAVAAVAGVTVLDVLCTKMLASGRRSRSKSKSSG